MSKRFPAARYALPVEVSPSGSVCYVVNVPDDPAYIAAFKGAIYDLAWSKVWERDALHTAADVARVWSGVFDSLSECPPLPSIRLKPTNFCMLQLSVDGGATWSDVADLSACAEAAVVAGIDDAILGGRIAPGGQLPPSPSPDPGGCTSYDIQLDGAQLWLCPVTVSDGDSVQIENSRGGWTDQNIIGSGWSCPEGTLYALGMCGAANGTSGTDPIPTISHMRLIAGYGATPSYVDAFDTTITIPGGTGDTDFWLQANDGVLSDNAGSISAKVTVCKAGWTSDFDFSLGDGGFVPVVGTGVDIALYSVGAWRKIGRAHV